MLGVPQRFSIRSVADKPPEGAYLDWLLRVLGGAFIVCAGLAAPWPAEALEAPRGSLLPESAETEAAPRLSRTDSGVAILTVPSSGQGLNHLELWVGAGTLDSTEPGIAEQTALAVASQALGTSELSQAETAWEIAPEYTRLSFAIAATQAIELAERLADQAVQGPAFASPQLQAFHATHYRPQRLSVILSATGPDASLPDAGRSRSRSDWTPFSRLAGPDNQDTQAQATLELAGMILAMRLETEQAVNVQVRFERRQAGSALIWEKRTDAVARDPADELNVLRKQWNALRTDLVRLEELTRARQLVAARRDSLYPQARQKSWRLGYGLCMAGEPRWWDQYLEALARVSRNDIQALCQTLE